MGKIQIKLKSMNNLNSDCGTKAMQLADLVKLGLSVPDFIAVPTSFFEQFRQAVGAAPLDVFFASPEYNPAKTMTIDLNNLLCSDEIKSKLTNGYYMVRSSSVPIEGTNELMFPSMISGAFDSYFSSSIEEISKNIVNVWLSTYSRKAYNQSRIFSTKHFIKGMGVVIQKYIEPIISGVVHTKEDFISVNWIFGHLSKIVEGEVIGNSVDVYKSKDGEFILRGIENNILQVINNHFECVFKSLFNDASVIKQNKSSNYEIEWIYDGITVWIVQSQPLISK